MTIPMNGNGQIRLETGFGRSCLGIIKILCSSRLLVTKEYSLLVLPFCWEMSSYDIPTIYIRKRERYTLVTQYMYANDSQSALRHKHPFHHFQ